MIVWLPLLLEMLDNVPIVIVCFSVYIINFVIRLSFLIKLFIYNITKKSIQKLKQLANEKSFYGGIKNIFDYFYRVFSCQKLSQT